MSYSKALRRCLKTESDGAAVTSDGSSFNLVYHNSRNASVTKCRLVPVSAKRIALS